MELTEPKASDVTVRFITKNLERGSYHVYSSTDETKP